MKITIYELLGLVKDGKAPKTIKSEGHYYNYDELEKDYYEGMGYDYEYLLANTSVKGLDNEIEIIEDTPKEEKKIPEKLGYFDLTKDENEKDENGNDLELHYTSVADTFNDVYEKINEIIDYLKSKENE